MSEPVVSVCVPTFNGGRHVEECLDSVVAQTFTDFEVLVVDDASTDDTTTVVERFRRRDPRVRVERNACNLGLVPNWNRCVELARGRWLKFVFQDDVIAPSCVEALLHARRPDCPLVVCRRTLSFEARGSDESAVAVSDEYSLTLEHSLDRLFGEVPYDSAELVQGALLDHFGVNFVGEPTAVMVERDAFRRFGRFNTALVALCDFEYWARLGANTGLAYVPESLATFRVHAGSASEINRTRLRFHKDWLDPLVLRAELATAPAFAGVRVMAARRQVDLEREAVVLAARARRHAEQALRAAIPHDRGPLDAWRRVVASYAPLARSPRLRALEVKYAVGRTLRARPAPEATSRARPAPEAAGTGGGSTTSVRVVAFYLPQFHPIPENDEWWGRGFTDWRNVVPARPLFAGHHQPHLPADLGLYDVRVSEVRVAQAELARAYGISAFCYYHYWFEGRRLLERPFDEVLSTGWPDLPFCLCWANERWTRAWDGRDSSVLVEQTYSTADDHAHARWLAPAFADERYLRVDGRPVFLVYRAAALPDARRTTDILRTEAQRAGIGELLLCRVESFRDEHGDPTVLGFDAAVEHQPDWTDLGPARRRNLAWRAAARAGLAPRAFSQHRVYDYAEVAERMATRPQPSYPRFPGLTPSWDNTPRRRRDGVVLTGSTPARYQRWMEACLTRAGGRDGDGSLVFVNAWNEWAEGNHLEPDARFGRGYLEATRRAVERAALTTATTTTAATATRA
jgi:glycosyltransferase involved in cell wall biosynthesis